MAGWKTSNDRSPSRHGVPDLRLERDMLIRPAQSQRWTFASRAILAYFLLFTALAILGFVHTGTRPLAGHAALWSSVFLVVYSPWLYITLGPRAWARMRETQPLWWKRAGAIVTGHLGIGFIYYLAIFGGIPKLLHYVNHTPGTLVTAVADKNDWLSRYNYCRPRLELTAISWPFYGDICVSRRFFDSVKVGDPVRVQGNISRYAIEPMTFTLIR